MPCDTYLLGLLYHGSGALPSAGPDSITDAVSKEKFRSLTAHFFYIDAPNLWKRHVVNIGPLQSLDTAFN
jgi:hypothetical protein